MPNNDLLRPIRVTGIEAVLPVVLRRYPNAWREGSCGYGNSFWIRRDGHAECIAVSFPSAGKNRVKNIDTETWIVEFGDPLYRNNPGYQLPEP